MYTDELNKVSRCLDNLNQVIGDLTDYNNIIKYYRSGLVEIDYLHLSESIDKTIYYIRYEIFSRLIDLESELFKLGDDNANEI